MRRFSTKYILKTLTNKYAIVLLAFFVWTIFLHEHNLLEIRNRRKKLVELQTENTNLENKIESAKRALDEFNPNSTNNNAEDFAREMLIMKKKDEDIILVE